MEVTASAIAGAEAEQKLRELADTQASLHHLAMLIARGEPPEAVFGAVTKEALRQFGHGSATVIRFELDGATTLLAHAGPMDPHMRVGKRWAGHPPTGLTATVLRSGRPARIE